MVLNVLPITKLLFVECNLTKEEKPTIKTKILKKIFRQDEVKDSTPEGPPVDLSHGSPYGLATTKCMDVKIPCTVGEGEKFLKAWFMEPESSVGREKVILYSHGVSNTRGAFYRVALYNILIKYGFTVLAYDYRGFADSSQENPTEETVVQDCKTALEWLRNKIKKNTKIVAWGHSLGAAVTCHALAEEFDEKGENTGVAAVILEAPFNNMADELKVAVNDVNNVLIKNIVKLFSKMGGLSKMTKDYDIAFQSDMCLGHIPCPVLMVAAEDDERIPVKLSHKLVDKARKEGKDNLTVHQFDASGKFGHKYMYKAENLPKIVEAFCNSFQL